jgi:hypothetical protein
MPLYFMSHACVTFQLQHQLVGSSRLRASSGTCVSGTCVSRQLCALDSAVSCERGTLFRPSTVVCSCVPAVPNCCWKLEIATLPALLKVCAAM